MTLPASGQISLGQVRTELGAAGQISLGQSTVRTLAGIPSGQIDLNALHGKSASAGGTRPTSYIAPYGMVNPTYAYDNSTSTYANFTSNTSNYDYPDNFDAVYSFTGSTPFTGTLTIKNTRSVSDQGTDSYASVWVTISINGGSTYSAQLGLLTADNNYDNFSSSADITFAINGIAPSAIKVKFSVSSVFYGYANFQIKDITLT